MEAIICTICREKYTINSKRPFNLSCGHSFCETCISELSRNKVQYKCPICSKLNNKSDQLSINWALVALINNDEYPNKEINCSKHSEKKVFYCEECEIDICYNCSEELHQGHSLKKSNLIKKIKITKILQENQKLFESIDIDIDQEFENMKKIFQETINVISEQYLFANIFYLKNKAKFNHIKNKHISNLNNFKTIENNNSLLDGCKANNFEMPYYHSDYLKKLNKQENICKLFNKHFLNKSIVDGLSCFREELFERIEIDLNDSYIYDRNEIQKEFRRVSQIHSFVNLGFSNYYDYLKNLDYFDNSNLILMNIKNLNLLNQHKEDILCLSNPNSNEIAYATSNKSIKVLDIKTWNELYTFSGTSKDVTCLILNNKGILISGSQDKTIRMWNTHNGSYLNGFNAHSDIVTCLISLQDNNIFASGSKDKFIKIWNCYDKKSINQLSGHSGSINCFALLNDGRLVSGSDDCSIRIWEALTNKVPIILEGHKNPVNSLSVKDKIITSASSETIRIWNKELNCYKIIQLNNENIKYLNLIRMDEYLLSCSDVIKFWDINTGECLKVFEVADSKIRYITILNYDSIFFYTDKGLFHHSNISNIFEVYEAFDSLF